MSKDIKKNTNPTKHIFDNPYNSLLEKHITSNKIKVERVKEELLKINNKLNIEIYPEKLSDKILEKIGKNIDLIVLSADDRYCRKMSNNFCHKNNIPIIIAGYMNDISTIGPFYIPKLKTSCLSCNLHEKPENYLYKNKVDDILRNYKAPSMFINNFLTGAMLASEILKFFAQDYDSLLSINKVIGIHNKTLKVETLDIEKNKNCLCSKEVS